MVSAFRTNQLLHFRHFICNRRKKRLVNGVRLRYDAIKSLFAGGRICVEKVKPDPLNLLANTSVGSNVKRSLVAFSGYRSSELRHLPITGRCLSFLQGICQIGVSLLAKVVRISSKENKQMMKTALTIAGSDCSGGAGIQADLKTFSAHGVFGMSAVTSVVAENTVRVISVQDISPESIKEQIDAVCEDIFPDAVKIGMLSGEETMLAVAESLEKWQPQNIVLDPVMYAKNGAPLMALSAIETLIEKVLPLATLITPNIPEAEHIAGMKIESLEQMKEAATAIQQRTGAAVLVKGGHAVGDATDILFDGNAYYSFNSPRIDTKNTHGTGCTLSSAICSQLALGADLKTAVAGGKDYITQAIRYSLPLGHGHGPTNHFWKFFGDQG